MTSLLEEIIDVLPDGQQLAVRSLLSQMRRTGFLQSPREQASEAERLSQHLQSRLGSKLLDPRYAVPGQRIDSAAMNLNGQEIYMDLSALYLQADVLGRGDKYQGATTQSDYLKSKAAIQKLLTDVRVFALRRKFPDFNDIKVVDFNSNKNHSTQPPTAVVSDRVRLLQLRGVDERRIHLNNRLSRTTRVTTRTIGNGVKGTLGEWFGSDNMVDQHPETFWGTIVLADAPITQRYESHTRSGRAVVQDVHGPITEIFLKFSHVEQLNTIRLLPFGEHPIKILDIAYKGSAGSQVYVQIDDFEPVATLDWVELNFDRIHAHEIRITIAQESSKRVIYHLPRSSVLNTDLLQEILRQRAEIATGTPFTPDIYIQRLAALDETLPALDLSVQTDIDYYDGLVSLLGESLEQYDQDAARHLINLIQSSAETPSDQLVEVAKYEYLLGVREVEISYVLYAPRGHFASEKFVTQASLAEVQLEVDERHTEFSTSWQDDHRKTSTEWTVDLGEGRSIPIHPRNITDGDLPSAKDELLEFDRFTATAYTRLKALYDSVYRLKKDSEVLPLSSYTVERQATGILKIVLESGFFDENSVYTVDYAVGQQSYAPSILELFSSRPVTAPEVFEGLGPNRDVVLSKVPFVDYGVINRTGMFEKDELDARWTYRPPQDDFGVGQLRIWPTIIDSAGNILVTGTITGQTETGIYGERSGEPALDFTTFGGDLAYFNDPHGYYIQLAHYLTLYEVSGFVGTTGVRFFEPPILSADQIFRLPSGAFTGDLSGPTPSGEVVFDWLLGVGLQSDNQIYALNQSTYTPIQVLVGGRPATNITDYEKLQHPAFSVGSSRDGDHQYIHAGKRLYFGQDVGGREIQVEYRWLNEHVQVQAQLRCHKTISPDLTPKVNEFRILLQDLIL